MTVYEQDIQDMKDFLRSNGWARVQQFLTEQARAVLGDLMNPGTGERAMHLAGQLKQLDAVKTFPEMTLRVLEAQNKSRRTETADEE